MLDTSRRFVVLIHDHPVLHWDLMFEEDGLLRTWRLESPPAPNTDITALALPDHRLMYLDYEGQVSGNRGSVTRWDAGNITQWHEDDNQLRCSVRGTRLKGVVQLTRDAPTNQWTFRYEDASHIGSD